MSEDLERALAAALQQLAERASTEPIDPAPIRRRAIRQRRWTAGPVTAVLIIAAIVAGIGLSRTHGPTTAGPASDAVCTPLHTGTPPAWATAGFTGNSYPPYAQSRSGAVIAFIFGNLFAPPDSVRHNKILWVERDHADQTIMITATLAGSQQVVTRQVPAGPSYVNMPTAGCWHLDLRIGTRHDSMDLVWTHP